MVGNATLPVVLKLDRSRLGLRSLSRYRVSVFIAPDSPDAQASESPSEDSIDRRAIVGQHSDL